MSSSTPLLTHPPRDDPRSSLKDTVTPGKEQSALSWNQPKRGGGKRAGDGGKQLPKPGVRNSRYSDPVAPVKPPQEPPANQVTSASTQLGTSALGTSTVLDFSAVNLEVVKRSPKLTRSAVVEGSMNLEKDKPVAGVNAEKDKPVAAVQRLKAPSSDEGPKPIISPPDDIPPTTLQLLKTSTPVLIPEVASAAKAVTPTRSADVIANKPRKASVVVDISKTRRSSIVEKLSRKTSTVDLPRQRKTSVTDSQRSRRMSVTDRGNPHQSESSRHSSNTDHHGRLAGITPETLRAAEVWKSRTNALKYRGGGGGGGRPLHVSFDDMVMDHLAEQKGMSEHKRRHNLHPLARFRSLAITTNNRARSKYLSFNLHPLARFRSLAITTNNRARSKYLSSTSKVQISRDYYQQQGKK